MALLMRAELARPDHWADPDRLDSDIVSSPANFTTWLHGVLATARAGR